ncbi:MAG: hypothetical protein SFU25_01855 [Candidatus Caenarcaniphilales bacterium]|nr:hypothetical protein [Candidatus Caenarcaniphilales bacterium]
MGFSPKLELTLSNLGNIEINTEKLNKVTSTYNYYLELSEELVSKSNLTKEDETLLTQAGDNSIDALEEFLKDIRDKVEELSKIKDLSKEKTRNIWLKEVLPQISRLLPDTQSQMVLDSSNEKLTEDID